MPLSEVSSSTYPTTPLNVGSSSSHIPDDVVAIFFEYLNSFQDVQSLSLVRRQFYSLALSPPLYTRIMGKFFPAMRLDDQGFVKNYQLVSRISRNMGKANYTVCTLVSHASEDSTSKVAISQDDKLICCFSDLTIKVWDMESGQLVQILKGLKPGPQEIIPYEDKVISYSNAEGPEIKIWDRKTEQMLHTIEMSDRWIQSVHVRKNKLYVEQYEPGKGYVSVWDMQSGKKLLPSFDLYGHSEMVDRVLIHNDMLISTSSDLIKVLDVETKAEKYSINTGGMGFDCIDESRNMLISSLKSGEIKYWNLADGSELKSLTVDLSGAQIRRIVCIDNILTSRSMLLILLSDGSISLRDLASGAEIRTLDPSCSGDARQSIAFGDKLIFWQTGDDPFINIVDMSSGKITLLTKDVDRGLNKVLLHDGKIVACSDLGVKIYDFNHS